MKIDWFVRSYRPDGGLERFVEASMRALAPLGVESRWVFLDPRPTSPPVFGTGLSFEAWQSLPARELGDVSLVHAYRNALDLEVIASRGKPRAVYLHDHRSLCLRRHSMTLRGQSCNRVTSWGCYLCPAGIQKGMDGGLEIRPLWALRREQAALQNFEILVPSEYMRERAEKEGLKVPASAVLPPYLAPEGPGSPSSEASPRALFVGALTRGKGIRDLVEVCLDLGIGLDVLGRGPLEAELHSRIAKRNANSQIQLHGAKSPSEVTRFLRSHALLVLPTRAPESFARVGPEALAEGLPVLVSDHGGVREWCSNPGVRTFAPGDLSELAQALLEAWRERKRLRQEAQDFAPEVRKLYSRDRFQGQWMHQIQRLGRTPHANSTELDT